MYPQVLDPCDPTNSQAEGWEGGAENLDTVHLKRGREVEKAAALLVIPTESKANRRPLGPLPTKSGTIRGHLCPGRGVHG